VRERALKGIIFDLDGTLIDSQYDWDFIRREIGVGDLSILSHIHNLKGASKERAMRILESFEQGATKSARLAPGMERFLRVITEKGMKKAIVTNNSRKTVDTLLQKFCLSFDYIITRDDGVWKPSGAPLDRVVTMLGLKKDEVIYIGNSDHDRIAAERAGIPFISVTGGDGIEKLIAMIESRP
jgi:HAD superfamily hydrolase (TIGR01549 family)